MTAPTDIRPMLPEAERMTEEQGRIPSRAALMERFSVGTGPASRIITELKSREFTSPLDGLVDQSTGPDRSAEDVARDIVATLQDAGVTLDDIRRRTGPVVDRLTEVTGPVPVSPLHPDRSNTEEDQVTDRSAVGPVPVRSAEVTGPTEITGPVPDRSAEVTGPVPDRSTGPVVQSEELAAIRRQSWGTRAALAFGVIGSIGGNILASDGSLIGGIVAAVPSVALLIAVEIGTRVRGMAGPLDLLRWAAILLVGTVAGWISYGHLMAVARHYGESGISAAIYPLAIDGLILAMSLTLVMLGRRRRELES